MRVQVEEMSAAAIEIVERDVELGVDSDRRYLDRFYVEEKERGQINDAMRLAREATGHGPYE